MKYLTIFFAFLVTAKASAATGYVDAKVLRLLTGGDLYGECMIYLDTNLAGAGINCGGNWVSLACDGRYEPKSIENQKYSAAQLAYVTGGDVRVWLDDTKKPDGVCYSFRVDNK